MAFGLPDLTKLPQEVQDAIGPEISALFDKLNALEAKSATDVGTLVHGSLTEALTDAQALENPLLQRIDNLQATLDKITGRGVRATLSMGGTFMDFTLIPAKVPAAPGTELPVSAPVEAQ